MKNKGFQKKGLIITGAIIALVLLNLIAAKVHQRADLTEDKRYSLSRGTKDLLRSLDEELTIYLFLKGNFPSGFRRLSNTAEEFAGILKETAPARVRYRFIAPDVDMGNGKTWADSLTAMGIAPVNLSVQVKSGQENKLVFPVALLTYAGRSQVVDLYPSSKRVVSPEDLAQAEATMEYSFAKGITALKNTDKPFVAYAVGNGQPTDARTYDLQQTLGANYKLFVFDLKSQKFIPDTIKALLIVKPTEPFGEAEKLKIDQYIMRGGKVVWAIDNLNAEQDSLRFKSQLIAYERNLNLNDLLFRYGVRLNPDLLMDLQCDFLPFAVGGDPANPQYEFLHWNYYPLFESRGNHSINKNLGLVAGRFVNSIDTVEVQGIQKTILLQSSANARTITTPALISPNENRNAPEDAQFRKRGIPAAVLLEGSFTSFYKNRISRTQVDSLEPYGGFKQNSPATKMVVISDGDILLNDVSGKQGPLPMGMNLFTMGSQYEYQFANRDFLMNTLEYLTSNAGVMQARNKEVILRLLDAKKTEAEKGKWQLINIALPILLIIILGIIYQQVRKHQFARG